MRLQPGDQMVRRRRSRRLLLDHLLHERHLQPVGGQGLRTMWLRSGENMEVTPQGACNCCICSGGTCRPAHAGVGLHDSHA